MAAGYEINYKTCVDPRYMCPICLLVIRQAVQTPCGHRFCEGCFKEIGNSSRSELRCPIDKRNLKANEVFPDVATRREILSLSMICNNAGEGCFWLGELRDLETHLSTCSYQEILCPNKCGVKSLRSALESHQEQCPARQIECPNCKVHVIYSALNAHLESCPKMKVTCPICERSDLVRESLKAHIDPINGDCPKVKIDCPYQKLGCKFQAERCEVDQHKISPEIQQHHLSLAVDVISKQVMRIQDLEKSLFILNSKVEGAVADTEHNHNRIDKISRDWRNHNVTGKLHWKLKLAGGRSATYCSPAFYTGNPGYKVQAILSMEGTHHEGECYSSIALSLLPGIYDDHLVFPFNATCDVTLIDQTDDSACQNYVRQIVLRKVPRHHKGAQAALRVTYRRVISDYIMRRILMNPGSRFMRHSCLHIELSVQHSVYPPPDTAGGSLSTLSSTSSSTSSCTNTPSLAAAVVSPVEVLCSCATHHTPTASTRRPIVCLISSGQSSVQPTQRAQPQTQTPQPATPRTPVSAARLC